MNGDPIRITQNTIYRFALKSKSRQTALPDDNLPAFTSKIQYVITCTNKRQSISLHLQKITCQSALTKDYLSLCIVKIQSASWTYSLSACTYRRQYVNLHLQNTICQADFWPFSIAFKTPGIFDIIWWKWFSDWLRYRGQTLMV